MCVSKMESKKEESVVRTTIVFNIWIFVYTITRKQNTDLIKKNLN